MELEQSIIELAQLVAQRQHLDSYREKEAKTAARRSLYVGTAEARLEPPRRLSQVDPAMERIEPTRQGMKEAHDHVEPRGHLRRLIDYFRSLRLRW